jgi:hypothetical protein
MTAFQTDYQKHYQMSGINLSCSFGIKIFNRKNQLFPIQYYTLPLQFLFDWFPIIR